MKKDLPKHVNPENHLVPKGPALNAKSPLDMFMAHLGGAVADLMTLNRFEEILSLLHVNDNELMKKKGEHGYDSLHKIRPLIKVISSNFENCSEPELFVAVDEQIVPFKGRHSLKVYMKKKPKKWGYKI